MSQRCNQSKIIYLKNISEPPYVVTEQHKKLNKIVLIMGEPVESVVDDAVGNALKVLNDSIRELDEDVNNLTDFQDRLREFTPRGPQKQQMMFKADKSKTDTERVLDIYVDTFFSEQDTPENVLKYSKKYDISLEAADFMDELLGVKDLSRKDILDKIRFLDGSNPMNQMQVNDVEGMAEYPKALRKRVIEDTGVEQTSLRDYRRRIENLEDNLLELNDEYQIPMDLDDAVHVVERFDELKQDIKQLKNRREHELNRRTDILDEYFENNLDIFYDDEDFENPVLDDLENLESAVEEAYSNLAIEYT